MTQEESLLRDTMQRIGVSADADNAILFGPKHTPRMVDVSAAETKAQDRANVTIPKAR